jgi:hypothetical protein
LSQCANACERTLARYQTEAEVTVEHELVHSLLFAVATVGTAGAYLDAESEQRRLALRLAVDVCRHAAVSCRRYGLDRDLLMCAAACERAASEAELALTSAA